MKGSITIGKNDSQKFRVACHYAKVSLDMGTEVGEEFIVKVGCTELQQIYTLANIMGKITDQQVAAFIEAEKAMKVMNDLRNEII